MVVLGEVKLISDDTTKKQAATDRVIISINKTREGYTPAAEVPITDLFW